ncbi:DUF2935 domain-containing protein [Metabacillus litoralis]|uniref:DUF2935 domain-containing protein n=1 Tax=Metabacillus TaxID=2675233 RepID=UPI0013CEE0B2|nr:DUF2935 domain-containing protein [Metabacillus litoralis]MCM3159926.1 DUF2935 domain-containing protein [Metabacillus litoralis]UHA59831.1 DUF2935 domain-containing protein [Metabacillus litoralis]
MNDNLIPVWDEHLFWLEVLQDHAYFVRDHLSVSEVDYVRVSQQYIYLFEELISLLNSIPRKVYYNDEGMISFAKKAWPVVKGYFEFEGNLQSLRIDNKVNLNLSPTYLNGTLAENQEYLRILTFLVQGKKPLPLPLADLMDLWLEDQLGHVLLFEDLLDPIELIATKQAETYINRYQAFIVQNRHLKGYLRFKEPNFARQKEFANDVGKTTIEMSQFIYSMVIRYKENKLLNKSTLRFLEHHFPETCYFIKKLSYYAPSLSEEASKCSLRRPSYS